jgi:hypothetical protein
MRSAFKEVAKENASVFEWGSNGNYRYMHYYYFIIQGVQLKSGTILTHWHTQPDVRRAEPSMPLLLILALGQ